MRRKAALFGLVLAAGLAGCGADGPPIPPDTREQPRAGITISGKAQIGVAGGSGGTRTVSRITN
ncbi:argininosuccinate lyase [Tropicimonas sp. IMCC6043]|uniref:argininosuccinate lyase n=1 Tax=Tropicimonas sp. IMCC6043 TaxID=2510645 RepID=UPI00101DB543|nr:argininosuccinate lyase [Tropicimonas sp. IMCC6043]RYH10562.1 argininosuccinate lyase [Tropicimonas sp. IMCC6043]